MMMNVLAPPSQGATSMASAVSFRLKYLRKQCNFIKSKKCPISKNLFV